MKLFKRKGLPNIKLLRIFEDMKAFEFNIDDNKERQEKKSNTFYLLLPLSLIPIVSLTLFFYLIATVGILTFIVLFYQISKDLYDLMFGIDLDFDSENKDKKEVILDYLIKIYPKLNDENKEKADNLQKIILFFRLFNPYIIKYDVITYIDFKDKFEEYLIHFEDKNREIDYNDSTFLIPFEKNHIQLTILLEILNKFKGKDFKDCLELFSQEEFDKMFKPFFEAVTKDMEDVLYLESKKTKEKSKERIEIEALQELNYNINK